MKTSTKKCPDCQADVAGLRCECGYDFSHEPCPACDKRIDVEASVCPHCQFNLVAGTVKKKKEPKAPAAPRTAKPRKERQTTSSSPEPDSSDSSDDDSTATKPRSSGRPAMGTSVIFVPALGRMGGRSIDFPELHLKMDCSPEDVSDEVLLEWALKLREVWNVRVSDSSGWLSNHALGYLAQQSDEKVLSRNSGRIVKLLGGDDW